MRYSHWISIALALVCLSEPALAQRRGGGRSRGGGGGGGFRGGASARSMSRPSVSRPSFNPGGGGANFNRPSAGRPSAGRPNVDRGNINNRPVDRGNINNVDRANINNRPINVNDVDVHGGYGYGDGWGCCSHPVAAGVAVGAAAALTSAAIGSVVYSLPSSCTTVIAPNGVTYDQCGDVWYQPQFEGTTTSYVVVNPPQ